MGTAQGKTKRISRLTVRVHNAIGGAAGPGNEATLEELVRREQTDAMDASPQCAPATWTSMETTITHTFRLG